MHDFTDRIDLCNRILLRQLSEYLNGDPCVITQEDLVAIMPYCDSEPEAYSLLLAAALGLNVADEEEHRWLYDHYFTNMVHRLQPELITQNPYFAQIRFPQLKEGSIRFTTERLRPYESFVCDDMLRLPDGRLIPQLGYFPCELSYPAVLENGRLWMSICPNEIASMRQDILDAHGIVVAYGLGLGYFPFMCSIKPQVSKVIVVDSNATIIDLFRRHLLPQFPFPEKIELVHADAFDHANSCLASTAADFVFVDLWHDVGDGLPLYVRMKEYEHRLPTAQFRYWIEATLKCYL